MNIFQHRLFVAAMIALAGQLFSGLAFGEQYYFAQGLYFNSVIKSEAQKDNSFDDELARRGMSTSTELFQDQPARRYGANIGKGFRDGVLGVEISLYADPAAETIFKHPAFGESHLRTDTIGVILSGSVTLWHVTGKAGAHISFTEADVHNWVLNEQGQLHFEEHEALRDLSAGLALGLSVNVYKDVSLGCIYLKDVGDVDKIGTDNHLGCGLGVVF
ncbi:MAG: hypothetical protein AB2806_08860 [Candidatus Thiodiazotropha sp.]